MNPRSTFIAVLIAGILAFLVAAVLQGQGDYFLGILVAIVVWLVLGLVLMTRWTITLQFWTGLSSWIRSLRR